jgi:hypothetical protein
MCHELVNLARKHRQSTVFPRGHSASPAELDQRFCDVPKDQRGRLSRLVLAAIPPEQKTKLRSWAAAKTNAYPTPDGHVELMLFYAIADATKPPNTVHATVNLICTKQSVAGILLAA